MSTSPHVSEASEADFNDVIEKSHTTPQLLDFWAEWCQPCRTLSPLLEKTADAYEGRFAVVKINVDECPNLAAHFRVEGIPALFLLMEGQIAGHATGALNESQLKTFLDRFLPTEADRMARRAEDLEAADAVAAQRLYEQALMLDEKHGPSRAGLAEILLQTGEVEQAEKLIEGIAKYDAGGERAEKVRSQIAFRKSTGGGGSTHDLEARAKADPANDDLQLELGQAYAAASKWEEALETLVCIVERNRTFGQQKVRPVMVQIFQVLGNESPLTNTFRSRLASALY